jgi:hypothetical protein
MACIRDSRFARRVRSCAFSSLRRSFSSWACSMASFWRSRDCLAAVLLATLRSWARVIFSWSVVARGRT